MTGLRQSFSEETATPVPWLTMTSNGPQGPQSGDSKDFPPAVECPFLGLEIHPVVTQPAPGGD